MDPSRRKGRCQRPEPRVNLPQARQELEGDGVLFPALVIGLGGLGLGVLNRYVEKIASASNKRDCPNAYACFISTPTPPHSQATVGSLCLHDHERLPSCTAQPSEPLHEEEESHGRLVRPKDALSHSANMLTTGLRALGRLAFVDNYHDQVAEYSRIGNLSDEREGLNKASAPLGLGLRDAPAGLHCLRLGWRLGKRHVPRRGVRGQAAHVTFGHESPEIIGIFLMPAVDRHPARTLGLGNTFAALTELNHFSAPGTSFTAQYDERERPLNDQEPPFARCIFLQLPEENEGKVLARNLRAGRRLPVPQLGDALGARRR